MRRFILLTVFMCLILPLNVQAVPFRIGGNVVTIGQNFTGSTFLVDSSFIPPDSNGAVGPDHFVEQINGRYSVYSKSGGARVQTSTLNRFWSDSGVSQQVVRQAVDPRIVYDHSSQRWFASALNIRANGPRNYLVAVSHSSDPTMGWTGFAVDSKIVADDFPTLGVDADGVYIADRFSGTVVSIPKADLLAPTPTIANLTSFVNVLPVIGAIQPAIDFGPSDGRAALLSAGLFSGDDLNRIDVLNAAGPGPASLSPVVDISVPAFTGSFNATQPDGSSNLESSSLEIQGAVKEVGDSLWAVHSIEVDGRSGIRWYEIDELTNNVVQLGLISDPFHDYFYPSIAANNFGDVVIGFNRSGLDEFVSSYALIADTVEGNTLFGDPVLLQAGVANYFRDFGSGRNRWGDYSATTLDPEDPFRFWTIQEWVPSENIWSTQITELIISEQDIAPIPEPSTMLLFGSGLAGLAAWRFRKSMLP